MEDSNETVVVGENAATPQSPLAALREKRDELAAKRDVMIPLPAPYSDMGMHVRYRLIGRDEADDIASNVRGQTRDRQEQMYRAIIDTMIRACDGFFLKPLGIDDSEAEQLKTPAGEAVESYVQLANEMKGGEPFTRQRDAVVYVFGDNEFAVGQHGIVLQRWLANTGLKIDADMLLEG